MDEGYPVDSESISTENRLSPNTVNLGLRILPAPTATGIDTHSDAQYTSANESESASNAGAFFPQSKDFVITGGVFTSNTHIHNPAPPAPSDFPMIPLGHLDLRHEIRLKSGSNAVRQGHDRGLRSVRKIYSARITGVRSKMTAAVYQGQTAKEEWQQEISQYAELRHPNLIQLFGTVSAAGLHAAVYHDELIPVIRIREERLRASHLSLVYFLTSMHEEFEDTRYYVQDVTGIELWSYYCTLWIRPSNGRLCIDLTLTDDLFVALPIDTSVELISNSATFLSGLSLLEPAEDCQMIASLSPYDYHGVCSSDFTKYATFSIPTHASVTRAAIYRRTSGTNLDNLSEIAYIPKRQLTGSTWRELLSGWYSQGNIRMKRYPIMENGWTRVGSSEAKDIECIIHSEDMDLYWLAQADHIFNRLGIASKYEDYVMVDCVRYWVKITQPRDTTPPSYLFLCPLRNIRPDTPGRFGACDWLAYWSLDPTGVERLSSGEAHARGLPAIEVGKKVDGKWWDSSVYDGIRQFHQAKGFDPDTQDVARSLGYPLFKLSTERDVPVSRLEEYNDSNGNEDAEVTQIYANDVWDEMIRDEGAVAAAHDGSNAHENGTSFPSAGSSILLPRPFVPSTNMAGPYDLCFDTTQLNSRIFDNPPPPGLGVDSRLHPFDFVPDYSAFPGQEYPGTTPTFTGLLFDCDSMVNYAPAFIQAPREASEFPTNNVFSMSHHDWNTFAPPAKLPALPTPPAASPLFVPEIREQINVSGKLTGVRFDRDSFGIDTNYAPAFFEWKEIPHPAELRTLAAPRASSPLFIPEVQEQADVFVASDGSNFDPGNVLHTRRASIRRTRSFEDAIAPVSKKQRTSR